MAAIRKPPDPAWFRIRNPSAASVTATQRQVARDVDASAKRQRWQEALCTVRGMAETPDIVVYNNLLKAVGLCGRWRVALEILAEMKERDVLPNTFSYTATVVGMGRRYAWQATLELVERMEKENVRPNQVFLGATAHALQKSKSPQAWASAERLLAKVPPPYESKLASSALLAMAKQGKWQGALEILENTRAPDPICKMSCAVALDKGDQWKAALAVLGDRPTSRISAMVAKNIKEKMRRCQITTSGKSSTSCTNTKSCGTVTSKK
eukprot:GEMP01065990.1.p1 GENE.GEMP01065990.1~~GEMP01065990.1.p1  ORF type:complete len:267 (+),score=63.86 GEMP01065990.1:82-882(+)